MVFSSLVFLCIFLPIVFLGHTILPGIRAKNSMLLLASLVFYAYGEPVYVVLMIASALCNYLFALWIERFQDQKKWIVSVAVILNLALLVIFKYAGFLTESVNTMFGTGFPVPDIRLPIGISFFTFQAMSYVIDVYRGANKAQKNFGKVLLYISFFPQLIAGPIVKYHDVEQEIEHRTQSADGVAGGIRRFIRIKNFQHAHLSFILSDSCRLQQLFCVFVLRGKINGIHITAFDNCAVLHNHDPVAELINNAHIVGNK